MKPIKTAILGAGGIANKMAQTLCALEEAELYAVASRRKERAKEFAEQYGAEKAYGSYTEMLEDPEVELVYVATPTSHHYEHTKLCLTYGKHVLCEKSFTTNAKQAKEVIALAEAKNLLLAEAIWTRYMPTRSMIDQIIADGTIGKPSLLTANLGYNIHHSARLSDPNLSGGALLDVGVYSINFAAMVFGSEIERINSTATRLETGVDAQNSITLTYKDGKMAQLYSTIMVNSDRKGIVYGDKGRLEAKNINNCEQITVYNQYGEEIASYTKPEQITGFEYQVLSCAKAIRDGKTECSEMPHSEIILMMEWMDNVRKQCGIQFPNE